PQQQHQYRARRACPLLLSCICSVASLVLERLRSIALPNPTSPYFAPFRLISLHYRQYRPAYVSVHLLTVLVFDLVTGATLSPIEVRHGSVSAVHAVAHSSLVAAFLDEVPRRHRTLPYSHTHRTRRSMCGT